MNTESGLRAIETVAVGDRVWAFDLVAGEWSLQSVLRTFVRDYDHDAVVITINGEEITSTQLHPFWVMDGSELEHRPVREHLYAPPEHSKLAGRWVDAVDLRPGDTVFLQATGPARIEAVRTEPANYPVYNFAVDGLKCYTVGRNSVLVHNSNGIELPTGGLSNADRARIQGFADRHNVEVHVVGSRASGTAGPRSDYDYILGSDGATSILRKKARRELPRGSSGGEIHSSRGETGIDVFKEVLDQLRPFITFRPGG